MDGSLRRGRIALGRAQTRYAPDDRVDTFDLSLDRADGSLVLEGAVTRPALRSRTITAVRDAIDESVTDAVDVLEAESTPTTVWESVVPCRADPDAGSECVTELLYGQHVEAYDLQGEWRRVRCPDGYVAWVPDTALTNPAGPNELDARITTTKVDVRSLNSPLYAGTPCSVRSDLGDGERRVTFATGVSASLPASAVTPVPANPTPDAVVTTATSFLGTDYVWGGMTVDGIDCSGLVWVAYACTGIRLPRDADQQRAIGAPVALEDLRPGDLLFFPGHVAISLGGQRVIHAEGDAGGVVRATLDPSTSDESRNISYSERLDEEFEEARRIL